MIIACESFLAITTNEQQWYFLFLDDAYQLRIKYAWYVLSLFPMRQISK
jgi:hypothetical protein